MRPGPAGALGIRRQIAIIGDEALAVLDERPLDDRMPATLDPELEAVMDARTDPVPAARDRCQCRRDIEPGERVRRRPKALRLCDHLRHQSLEQLQFQRERLFAGRGDARLQPREFGGGKAHRAGHGLAMDEGRVEGLLQKPLARLLRHLDEIAEHGVVPDFQPATAG